MNVVAATSTCSKIWGVTPRAGHWERRQGYRHSDARGEITQDSNNLLVATQEGKRKLIISCKKRFMMQCLGFRLITLESRATEFSGERVPGRCEEFFDTVFLFWEETIVLMRNPGMLYLSHRQQ